jgi:hypothetical protein
LTYHASPEVFSITISEAALRFEEGTCRLAKSNTILPDHDTNSLQYSIDLAGSLPSHGFAHVARYFSNRWMRFPIVFHADLKGAKRTFFDVRKSPR